MTERSADIRKSNARDVEAFLNAVTRQTPPAGTVTPESGLIDEFENGISKVSLALGPLIPMTITTWASGVLTNRTAENPNVTNGNVDNGASMSFTMLVNPSSVNWGKTNAAQSSYARNGYVVQAWGPNQETITANGRSPSFMVAGEGLTSIGKRRSQGFKNMMALFSAYRNNGYELIRNPATSKVSRVINKVRGILIDYDGSQLLGHFTNFTLDNSGDMPYAMEYNFEFVVSNTSGEYAEIRGHFAPPNPQVLENVPVLLGNLGTPGGN